MTLESSSRIGLGLAMTIAVNAVPPIIAKEKRRTRHRKAPASVEKTNGQPFWIALRALPFPALTASPQRLPRLCISRCRCTPTRHRRCRWSCRCPTL